MSAPAPKIRIRGLHKSFNENRVLDGLDLDVGVGESVVVIADIIGVFGGYVVSVYKLGFNPYIYLKNTLDFMEFQDVASGLVKAAVFGFLITLMGCYHGYNSKGGAQGVGAATTNAVVSASILILSFNYLITEMFFSK